MKENFSFSLIRPRPRPRRHRWFRFSVCVFPCCCRYSISVYYYAWIRARDEKRRSEIQLNLFFGIGWLAGWLFPSFPCMHVERVCSAFFHSFIRSHSFCFSFLFQLLSERFVHRRRRHRCCIQCEKRQQCHPRQNVCDS